MAEARRSQLAKIAYIAAAIFFVRLLTFLFPSLRDANALNDPLVGELICILGTVPHLLLFPVVAALPAPRWARAAGYGWLVIDMATGVMQLNGAPHLTYISLKYGGHIAAALWIAIASWQAKGATRIIGWITALDLGLYSFLAPLGPLFVIMLLPSLVLLPLWFALAGYRIAQEIERQPGPSSIMAD